MAKPNRRALSVLVVLFLAAFAAAQSYTITDLGSSDPLAINSLGDVVAQGPNGNSSPLPRYREIITQGPGASMVRVSP